MNKEELMKLTNKELLELYKLLLEHREFINKEKEKMKEEKNEE